MGAPLHLSSLPPHCFPTHLQHFPSRPYRAVPPSVIPPSHHPSLVPWAIPHPLLTPSPPQNAQTFFLLQVFRGSPLPPNLPELSNRALAPSPSSCCCPNLVLQPNQTPQVPPIPRAIFPFQAPAHAVPPVSLPLGQHQAQSKC